MVATNESIIPMTLIRIAITAVSAKSVNNVRRGARSKLRNGILPRLLSGKGSRLTAGAIPPPRAARWPVLIASTGATRTARYTGHNTASIGRANPSAAALAKMPV